MEIFKLLGTVAVDTSEANKNIDSTVDKVESSESKLSSVLGKIGAAVVAAFAADKIKDFGEAVVGMADDAQQALNDFSAATGATGDELEGYEDVLKSIYKNNYGESFEDIAASMATVKQQMGDISGEELEEATTTALMLRDTFDMEVNESMRAAKMLMDQFGISSNDAYNLIAQGAQKGLNKNDDLLDSVNEYAVHYKQMGYDAEEFFASLENGTAAGTFSVDKLGDAMKEFGIRVKDGSDSTADAFVALGLTGKVSSEVLADTYKNIEKYQDKIAKLEKNLKYAKIQQEGFTETTSELTKAKTADNIAEWSAELENLQSRLAMSEEFYQSLLDTNKTAVGANDFFKRFAAGGEEARAATEEVLSALYAMDDKVAQDAAGVALFGTMWEDLGAAGIEALMNTEGAISTNVDALKQINKVKYNSFKSAMEGVKRTFETSIMIPLGEEILPLLTEQLPKKLAKIEEIAPKILNAFKTIISGVQTAITTATQFIAPFVQSAGDFITTSILPKLSEVWTAFQDYMALIMPIIQELIDAAVPIVEGAFTIVGELCGALLNTLTTFYNSVTDAIASLSGSIDSIIGVCSSLAAVIMDNVVANFNVLIEIWNTVFMPVIQTVIEIITALISEIIDAAVPAIEKITEKFDELAGMVRQAVTEYILPVIQDFVGMIQDLWQENKDKVEKIGELFERIFGEIADNIGNLVDWVKDTVMPFVDGICGFFQENMDIIKGIFQGVIDFVFGMVDAFIALFDGDWTALWEGVKDALGGIWDSICGIFSLAWEGIKAIWDATGIGDFFAGVWDGIKNAFGAVGDWFSNVFAKAWQGVKDIFCKGGEIFDGITDGIAEFFKKTVNGIIGGINKVIAIPFNQINDILEGISKINIFGLKPFDWVTTFNVPQIPELEEGGVLAKGQVGLLEGNGAEAVVPLEKNTGWLNEIAARLTALQGSGASDELLKELLKEIKNLNSSMVDKFVEALERMHFDINNREFARLVREV